MAMSDREKRLRAGHKEMTLVGDFQMWLYWEPHFDGRGMAVQDFVVETGVNAKVYIHDFNTASAYAAKIEREYVINAMAKALIGPQDTVKIGRPPKFDP